MTIRSTLASHVNPTSSLFFFFFSFFFHLCFSLVYLEFLECFFKQGAHFVFGVEGITPIPRRSLTAKNTVRVVVVAAVRRNIVGQNTPGLVIDLGAVRCRVSEMDAAVAKKTATDDGCHVPAKELLPNPALGRKRLGTGGLAAKRSHVRGVHVTPVADHIHDFVISERRYDRTPRRSRLGPEPLDQLVQGYRVHPTIDHIALLLMSANPPRFNGLSHLPFAPRSCPLRTTPRRRPPDP